MLYYLTAPIYPIGAHMMQNHQYLLRPVTRIQWCHANAEIGMVLSHFI